MMYIFIKNILNIILFVILKFKYKTKNIFHNYNEFRHLNLKAIDFWIIYIIYLYNFLTMLKFVINNRYFFSMKIIIKLIEILKKKYIYIFDISITNNTTFKYKICTVLTQNLINLLIFFIQKHIWCIFILDKMHQRLTTFFYKIQHKNNRTNFYFTNIKIENINKIFLIKKFKKILKIAIDYNSYYYGFSYTNEIWYLQISLHSFLVNKNIFCNINLVNLNTKLLFERKNYLYLISKQITEALYNTKILKNNIYNTDIIFKSLILSLQCDGPQINPSFFNRNNILMLISDNIKVIHDNNIFKYNYITKKNKVICFSWVIIEKFTFFLIIKKIKHVDFVLKPKEYVSFNYFTNTYNKSFVFFPNEKFSYTRKIGVFLNKKTKQIFGINFVVKKHYTQLIAPKQIKWKNFAIFNLILTDINNSNYCTTLLLTLFIPQINKKCYKYYYLLNTTFSKKCQKLLSRFCIKWILQYYNYTFFTYNLFKFHLKFILIGLSFKINCKLIKIKFINTKTSILGLIIYLNNMSNKYIIFDINKLAPMIKKTNLYLNFILSSLKLLYINKTNLKKIIFCDTKTAFQNYNELMFLTKLLKKKNNNFEILLCPTFTTWSFKTFNLFTIFCKNQINNLNNKSASFIRTGYKGGRTEIFQPFTTIQNNENNLYYIDFKSFYPAIALLLPIPVGKMIYTLTYKHNKLGIYLCRIFFYKTNILPYLSVTINENKELVFPNGLWISTLTSTEINFAIKKGYKIEIIEGFFFETKNYPFLQYFLNFQDIKEYNNNNKSYVKNIVKFCLNSLLGRLGKNETKYLLSFKKFNFLKPPMQLKQQSINNTVHISMFINSYAKLLLYFLLTANNIFPIYCDTDAAIICIKNYNYSITNINYLIYKNFKKNYKFLNKFKLATLDNLLAKSFFLKKIVLITTKFYFLLYESKKETILNYKIKKIKIFKNQVDLTNTIIIKTNIFGEIKSYLNMYNWFYPLNFIKPKNKFLFFGLIKSNKKRIKIFNIYKVWITTNPQYIIFKQNKILYYLYYSK